jgi:NitT/TauT family transport system substrate-binding protein
LRLASIAIGIALVALILAAIAYQESRRAIPERPRIRVGYLKADVHQASFFIAKALGMWEKEGIEVETKEFAAGPAEMEAFAAGELDVGYVGTPPATTGIARGIGVKIIAGVNYEGSALVVRKESGIARIEDLKGKRIGTPLRGSIQDVMLREELRKNGIDPEKDLTLLEFPALPDVVLALQKGEIDGFIAWAPMPAMAIVAGVGEVLLESKEMWEMHPCCVLIASQKLIQENPSLVKKLLEIHLKAMGFIEENPEEAISLVARETGVSREVIAESFKRIKFRARPDPNGTLRFAGILHGLGYIERLPSEEEIFDLSFYQVATLG